MIPASCSSPGVKPAALSASIEQPAIREIADALTPAAFSFFKASTLHPFCLTSSTLTPSGRLFKAFLTSAGEKPAFNKSALLNPASNNCLGEKPAALS